MDGPPKFEAKRRGAKGRICIFLDDVRGKTKYVLFFKVFTLTTIFLKTFATQTVQILKTNKNKLALVTHKLPKHTYGI